MLQLLADLGFNFKDVFMLGVCVGIWIGNRGRRHMGERVGILEDAVAAWRATREVEAKKDANR